MWLNISFSNIYDFGTLVKEYTITNNLITMDSRLKKPAARVAVLVIICSCVLTSLRVAHSSSGGEIDLFTEKEIYNGKGLNMSSDAFGPGQNITIHALVTYNDYPVREALVGFAIDGPKNPIQNISEFRTAPTNGSGIASINIGVGLITEIYFGQWLVVGRVRIAENIICQDTLSFEVGWIVNITSVETIDENHLEQDTFTIGGRVGVKLTLENIAMIEKNVTVTLTIHDEMDHPIQSAELENLILPSNETIVDQHFLSIPKDAMAGNAMVYVSAYTAPIRLNGTPYCPTVSKQFFITSRNIAVLNVQPYPTEVYQGETVIINVTIGNQGWKIESFNVSVHFNETLIDTSSILGLQPHSNVTVDFIWNTSQVEEGLYRISAYAEPVFEEVDITDNTWIDGFVKVKASSDEAVFHHDVAVLNVTSSDGVVRRGETVAINVTVRNLGGFVESFNVTVYYDSTVAGSVLVDSLLQNSTETLVFHWNTEGVSRGSYTLSALAIPVESEENVDDNYFEDGIIEITVALSGWFGPFSLWWLFLVLLILVLILLALWLYRRRKRKKNQEDYY